MRVSLLFVVAVVVVGCTREPTTLPAAPGAKVVLSSAHLADGLQALAPLRTAGIVVVDDATWAQLDALRTSAPAAPVVVSVLNDGTLVAAVGVNGAALLNALAEPILYAEGMRAGKLNGVRVIARARGERLFLAASFPPGQEAMLALALGGMAQPEVPAAPTTTAPLHVEVPALSLGVDVSVDGDAVVVRGAFQHPSASWHAALRAPTPPWWCSLDQEPALLLLAPPVGDNSVAGAGVNPDLFAGRLALGIFDDTAGKHGTLLAGMPRTPADNAVLLQSVREGLADLKTPPQLSQQGPLEVLSTTALRAARGDGVFALAIGAGVPLPDPSATCSGPPPLLVGDGRRLAAAVLPVFITPQLVAEALAGAPLEDLLPLSRLSRVGRFRVNLDASADDVVAVDARFALVPVAK